MKLWEYEDKHIRIVDVDGRVFTGIGDYYTSALDAPDGIPSLTLDLCNGEDYVVSFTEDIIASIEIFPAISHQMAEAV